MPYQIPASCHRTELEINRSLFITTASFAQSVDVAKQLIQDVRTEMPDANHHVYGYRIGYGNSVIEGMSDAGEPTGTSGPPTLAVLRGSDIGDIVLVTTRYFGGTKLGKGGLVRAYTEAAQLCLGSLPLTLKIAKSTLLVSLHYRFYDSVSRALPAFDAEIIESQFSESVTLTITLPADKEVEFKVEMTNLTSGTIDLAPL